MIRKVIQYLLMLFEEWRKSEAEKAVVTDKAKTEIVSSTNTIAAKLEEDQQVRVELEDRSTSLADKAKDLGLILILVLLLPSLTFGQVRIGSPSFGGGQIQVRPMTAEERIAVMTHEELKVYTQQMVDLAREQMNLIKDMQVEMNKLDQRNADIRIELEKIKDSINGLSAASKKSRLHKVLDWTVRLAPAVLAGVAATR